MYYNVFYQKTLYIYFYYSVIILSYWIVELFSVLFSSSILFFHSFFVVFSCFVFYCFNFV